MRHDIVPVPSVTVLDGEEEITLAELCRASAVHAKALQAMVEEGILEPMGSEMHLWRFPGTSIRRARVAVRLQRDLGVNLAGAALAIELLERIAELEAKARKNTHS